MPVQSTTNSIDNSRLVRNLRQSRKYRHLCEETLVRVAAWSMLRNRGFRKTLKAAKSKLHQVYGAYFDQVDFAEVEELIDGLSASVSAEARLAACRNLLRQHRSTAERLPFLEGLYGEIWSAIGRPRSIVDLACGFNPFALPWMDVDPCVNYRAYDIDHRLVSCINTFFARLNQAGGAQCTDILTRTPALEGDVVFLFQSIPCLEHTRRDASLELLRKSGAPYVVASFPSRSFCGRNMGMKRNYALRVERLADELGTTVIPLSCPREDFYIFCF